MRWLCWGAGLVLPLAVAAQDVADPGLAVPKAAPTPALIESTEAAGSAAAVGILTVDQDALFQRSAWGRRAQAGIEAAGAAIQRENQRLFEQLSAEEAALTEQRKTLPPAEFRQQAEAFDTRATKIRRERAQAVDDLNASAEADRAAFYRAALPVMGALMAEREALVVLDRRSVFASAQSIDITEALIARLDEVLGDGADLSDQPADRAE